MSKVKLSKDFYLNEFACRDGSPVPEAKVCNVKVLALNLQALRDDLGESITILSGYRTPAWNTRVGGAKNSMHLQAKASDLTTKNFTPKQLHARIEKLIKDGRMQDGGLGLYPGFVHYDIGSPRRWKG